MARIKAHDWDLTKEIFSLALLHVSPARETETLQLDFQMYCEALNFLSCHKDSSKGLNGHHGCEQEQPGEESRSVVISDEMVLNSWLCCDCLSSLSWCTSFLRCSENGALLTSIHSGSFYVFYLG